MRWRNTSRSDSRSDMRIFVTDCEGPISKNDNAMELAASIVPQGERFFALLSRYDDFLADVEQRPGYKAGDTLRLILPFLKAFGATDKGIEEFSRANILLMPGAAETLCFIRARIPAFIISTSYEPYIRALCEVIDFPFEQTFCTKLVLDCYDLPEREESYLREAAEEIACMPMIEWENGATGLADLSDAGRQIVERLNQIFWQELAGMQIGRVLEEVDPVGGEAKAAAVRAILKRTGAVISEVMYVGDSITDVQALEMVKSGGGLALSFNGNAYAIKAAQVACLARDTVIISICAQLFAAAGRKGVLALLPQWGRDTLLAAEIAEEQLAHLSPDAEIGAITPDNQARWTERSQEFRKHVRGVRIGSLG
jgi:energy-converting hydrogenase A subunit R